MLWQAISLLGAWPVVFGLALAVSYWLLRQGRQQWLKPLWLALLGTGISVYVLKQFIARPRPEGALTALYDSPFSFPSNHAAVAVVFWGLVAYMFWQLRPRWRWLAAIGGLLITSFIGVSRWALGVHFVSDVIGGYVVGMVWLAAALVIRKRTS